MTDALTSSANWAGNYRYRAARIAQPETLDEMRDLILDAKSIRALGSRHSFNDLADTSDLLISTSRLPGQLHIDPEAHTVTVGGGVRYGDLARGLHEEGWALHNLASLPHISVGGAIATATHGSGDRNGNLATAVAALRILTAQGDLVDVRRGDPEFEGAVVSLGALGIVTHVTLDILPTFTVRQRLYDQLPWESVTEHFDSITSAAYSVSLFTTWDEDSLSLAWLKERDHDDRHAGVDFFGARPLTEPRHMISSMDPQSTTPQLGVSGPWSERLAHFRYEFTPSNGAEIQSEYLVPRVNAVDAIAAVRTIGPLLAPVLQISEIRTVAADTLWLSSSYDTDIVGLHFTWLRDKEAVETVLPALEGALLPLGARPHWGKVYLDQGNRVPSTYPRLDQFAALLEEFDPRQRFRNEFLRRLLS